MEKLINAYAYYSGRIHIFDSVNNRFLCNKNLIFRIANDSIVSDKKCLACDRKKTLTLTDK